MPNSNIEELLSASIGSGGLNQEQISKILGFRVFGNKSGFLHLENMPIGNVPLTPASRKFLSKPDDVSEKCILQAASILGEPIGYVQESNGSIINNFFPHPSLSRAATSDSYDAELDLHTENAFHAVLPDFLILLCLRQDPLAEAITYVTSIDSILEHLSDKEVSFFLTEPYNFLSDYDCNEKNRRLDIGKNQTVLYGDTRSPFFRFDPQFMVARNQQAQAKLQRLREVAWLARYPVKLRTGDLLIIDNRKTAHARSQFTARFDGSDRWIQRVFAISNQRYYTEKMGRKVRVFDLAAEL
ncbi:TauD/TfdA family dioxygenase [Enterobacterales bacterium AE_CKDN230030158-1A_HGKHYDSX7]